MLSSAAICLSTQDLLLNGSTSMSASVTYSTPFMLAKPDRRSQPSPRTKSISNTPFNFCAKPVWLTRNTE